MIPKQELQHLIEEYLKDTDYELVTLLVAPLGYVDVTVEIDSLKGVDVDFCAELNRYLVEQIDWKMSTGEWHEENYELEVGSVSLTDPFVSKLQYQKHLGHDVEVLVEGKKLRGQLVSVDEETFSVDIEEKVKVTTESGKVKTVKQTVTRTWRYEEPKYVKYDLKF